MSLTTSTDSKLALELAPLVSAYEACWNQVKPTQLRSLWDPQEPGPFYVAEEVAEVMTSWDAIEHYWRETERVLERFSLRTWNHNYKYVDAHFVAMQFMMHWNGTTKGDPRPLGLDVRVSALARKMPAQLSGLSWRFAGHYIEAPVGALAYVKAVYRKNVDADF